MKLFSKQTTAKSSQNISGIYKLETEELLKVRGGDSGNDHGGIVTK